MANKKHLSAKLKQQKTKREATFADKQNEVMKELDGVDIRCLDEIDELKKIFYKFFIKPEKSVLASDQPAAVN